MNSRATSPSPRLVSSTSPRSSCKGSATRCSPSVMTLSGTSSKHWPPSRVLLSKCSRCRPAPRQRPHRHGRDPHPHGNRPGDDLVHFVVAGVESESSPLRVGVAPPHRSFSAAASSESATRRSAASPASVGYAVFDAGNDYVKVIGDGLSASASHSRWLAKPIIKAELYMFFIVK